MPIYIHNLPEWPKFRWQNDELTGQIGQVRYRQGLLIGRMRSLGTKLRDEATLDSRTEEVLKSSEIEGEELDRKQVRSSVANRLGIDIGATIKSDRNVDGVVEMILDATINFDMPLTESRLFAWHAALFPSGYTGMHKITPGAWRTDRDGPMQVVSGAMGHERVHYEAPAAGRVPQEMVRFLDWFNDDEHAIEPVLKAAVAHFWFVTIHPFEDGNGRIGRAIMDMALARSEQTNHRYYSMSAQIRSERTKYYDFLEDSQKGDLDITNHLSWFLGCLDRALTRAEFTLASVLRKAQFWERFANAAINARQRNIVTRLLDGFEGKLNTSKWAKITKSSQDTALRDIEDLIKRGILVKDPAGGRSTSYSLIDLSTSINEKSG
jgi:Fic family protein